MKVVVREVSGAEDKRLRALLAELGTHPSNIQRVFPNAPTARTGKTKVNLPDSFSVVVYLDNEASANKLAEIIRDQLGKDCTTAAV